MQIRSETGQVPKGSGRKKRVDENGERWVRPTKQAHHEASVNGAIYAALLLGATILDGPTIQRLQREERESRPAAAREARSNFRAIVDQIIETHAGSNQSHQPSQIPSESESWLMLRMRMSRAATPDRASRRARFIRRSRTSFV